MRSLPEFSVDNPILVSVLMISIIAGGVYGGFSLVREMLPEVRPDAVVVTTLYPGATPAEIEKGISKRIEEETKDLDDVEKVETRISEGLSMVIIELTGQAKDIDLVVNDVKALVDAIPANELPEDAEASTISKLQPRLPVISAALYGDATEQQLKDVGRRLKDDLQLLPGVSDVVIGAIRKDELTVEVTPEKLIEYGTSLVEIRNAIAAANLDLPAGQIKTTDQNVAVRTLGETDEAARIAETIVRTMPNGEIVRVSDLGQVCDGFEDAEVLGRFNGHRAVNLTIYKTGSQDAVDISMKVRAFVAGKLGLPIEYDLLTRIKSGLGIPTVYEQIYEQAARAPYPTSITVKTHMNLARFIEQRLDLLERNGFWGLCLVFISLLFFLNWRIALWVMMGLIISVCGAIMLMTLAGETLSLISMFGLIIVLGLIVDDAIVVGENIYSHVERGVEPRLAAIRGTEEVTWPVIVAVLTTVAAFVPLKFIEGQFGDFMGVLPLVVACALSISLIESLSILPSHLAEWLQPVRRDLTEDKPRHWLAKKIGPLRKAEGAFVAKVLTAHYEGVLRKAVKYRYVTLAIGTAALVVAVGFVAGGHVPFVLIQKMDSETLLINLEMPVGTPTAQTDAALGVIEQAALALEGEVQSVYALIGGQTDIDEVSVSARSHLGQLILELKEVDQRERTSEDVIADLRKVGETIIGVNSIRYLTMQGGPGGKEIEIEIVGHDFDQMQTVAETLKQEISGFAGVFDISDDFEEGRRELQLQLRDSARPLGLTTEMLATHVRGAFYGLTARTLQRDHEDVEIRVRFPEDRRRNVYELEEMRIPTPQGEFVPFSEVATLVDGQGYSGIRRMNFRRAVVVSADVDQSVGNSDEILNQLALKTIPNLKQQMPGLDIEFGGNRRETAKSFSSLQRDFAIAIICIYVLLVALFKSYVRPMIVLTAIPFGLIGAVAGHFIMGYPLTMLSMIGIVALTGIVVNDALILVDFVNKEVEAGHPVRDAVIHAGRRRLRPILLTTLTTVLGLLPLLTETSFQAKFLIPMAISISFGLMFATMLTLIIVPASYMIVHDFKLLMVKIGLCRIDAETRDEAGSSSTSPV